MKSKLSWIPFIPLALAACFFKLAQGSGSLFGLSALQMDYIYMGAVALIFVFALIFCLPDKKISDYYLTCRNLPAGIFGILLTLALAADGAFMLLLAFRAGKADVLNIIGAVLALLSAIVFIVFGLNHTFFNKEGKHFALINAVPALYCAVRMILSFVDFTTVSIRLADVSRLICYMFATMFFFYYAVMLSRTKTKKAVKFCFVYGLPTVAAAIPYGIYNLIFAFDKEQMQNNIQPLVLLLIGLYVLSFLIELTSHVLDKDSVTIIADDEPVEELPDDKVEGFFATAETEDESDKVADPAYLETRDTEGFLYDEDGMDTKDNRVNEHSNSDVENFLTNIEKDNPNDDEKQRKSYDETLDDIDRLLIEITEKSD